jgi:hypothetical protein
MEFHKFLPMEKQLSKTKNHLVNKKPRNTQKLPKRKRMEKLLKLKLCQKLLRKIKKIESQKLLNRLRRMHMLKKKIAMMLNLVLINGQQLMLKAKILKIKTVI